MSDKNFMDGRLGEWKWNPLRRSWEHRSYSIYPLKDGGFVISDGGGWRDGVFDSFKDAEEAFIGGDKAE